MKPARHWSLTIKMGEDQAAPREDVVGPLSGQSVRALQEIERHILIESSIYLNLPVYLRQEQTFVRIMFTLFNIAPFVPTSAPSNKRRGGRRSLRNRLRDDIFIKGANGSVSVDPEIIESMLSSISASNSVASSSTTATSSSSCDGDGSADGKYADASSPGEVRTPSFDATLCPDLSTQPVQQQANRKVQRYWATCKLCGTSVKVLAMYHEAASRHYVQRHRSVMYHMFCWGFDFLRSPAIGLTVEQICEQRPLSVFTTKLMGFKFPEAASFSDDNAGEDEKNVKQIAAYMMGRSPR